MSSEALINFLFGLTEALTVIVFGLAVCAALGAACRWLAWRCPEWLKDWLAKRRGWNVQCCDGSCREVERG